MATTTIKTAAGLFKVFNTHAQQHTATAHNLVTGEKYIIGGYGEKLNLKDEDDLESRILACVAWRHNPIEVNNYNKKN